MYYVYKFFEKLCRYTVIYENKEKTSVTNLSILNV
jgi:hypothetical protein